MKKYVIPVLTGLFVTGIIWATSLFPTFLNNLSDGDVLEADVINNIEETIGITNSAVTTSHDYLIKHATSSLYTLTPTNNYVVTGDGTRWQSLSATWITPSNWQFATANALRPTSTVGIIVNASSTFEGYITALGFTGNASTSDSLKANPTDCAANQFANAIVASGNLTCSAIGDADVPDTITVSNYLNKDGTTALTNDWNAGSFYITATGFTGKSSTTNAFAINPSDCASSETAAYQIDTSGNLTCATFYNALSDIPLTSKFILVGNTSNVASSTSSIIIDTNGYVGIATSTPTTNFSVDGSAYISGDYNTPNGEVADYREKCLTMASTTWQGITIGGIPVWFPRQAIKLFETSCFADSKGTTTLKFTSNNSPSGSGIMTCGYKQLKNSTSSDNVFIADEAVYLTILSFNGTNDYFNACLRYYIVQD